MADLQASNISFPGDPIFGRVTLAKKTAADDIQVGDFLSSDGANGVFKMTADTDDATFVGVSGTLSADATATQLILVYTQCICECPVTSAAYAFAAELKWVTAGLVASGGANGIAHAWETKGTTTTLKVMVDSMLLAKLFAVTA